MRKLHLIAGLAGVVVFLGTGLYMHARFPALYGGNEALRFMYRANHVYLLLASLVNVALGVYLARPEPGWRATLGKLGSTLVLASPAMLALAFFVEVPQASPQRVLTLLGILLALLGVTAQVPAAGRRATPS
jgi:hypothetical protein